MKEKKRQRSRFPKERTREKLVPSGRIGNLAKDSRRRAGDETLWGGKGGKKMWRGDLEGEKGIGREMKE